MYTYSKLSVYETPFERPSIREVSHFYRPRSELYLNIISCQLYLSFYRFWKKGI